MAELGVRLGLAVALLFELQARLEARVLDASEVVEAELRDAGLAEGVARRAAQLRRDQQQQGEARGSTVRRACAPAEQPAGGSCHSGVNVVVVNAQRLTSSSHVIATVVSCVV